MNKDIRITLYFGLVTAVLLSMLTTSALVFFILDTVFTKIEEDGIHVKNYISLIVHKKSLNT